MLVGNGTGRLGWGPMTGRQAGYGAGYPVPGRVNRFGAFSYGGNPVLSPYPWMWSLWGRTGLYGRPWLGGRGWFARGRGRGLGWRGRGRAWCGW